MSVDLKGNTNYVALRGLPTMVNGTQVPGPYVVPRTNLSAIDMNVANGISAEGDTLGITLADPLEVISNMHGIGLLNADTLATALSYSRSSILDVTQLKDIEFIGSVPTVINSNDVTTVYGIPITSGGTNKLQINYNGPLPAVSEEHGLWLITADVMSTAEDVTEIGMSMGPTTPITGYSDVSVNPNVWTRLAFLLNTNSSLYDGSLVFYADCENASEEESFSFKNVSVVEVSDLEAKYQAELAGVIGTPDAYMFKPGKGISIKDSTISMSAEPATVKQVIDGSEDALVGNLELTGAVTAGKAVDVTNMPSVTAGTLDTGVSAMQDMIWSGTTSGNIGFYNAATKFPAYADGLVYLMLADVTNNGISNVTITGTDAVNSSLPVVIPSGKTARVAMLFTTATTGYFHAESTVAFDLTFSKLRELEVTGCSEEAREYIASLVNPDNTDDYYLVDQDSVNPWLPMIDMKQSPYTLVQPGLAYKLFANDGEIHTLAVPTIKANTYGRAAYVELFVGSGANIKCQSPLRLADGHSLSDNTLNNCSVKFMDGIATLTVDSTESSYIVTAIEGTTSGTLAYGLSGSTASLIIFNSAVDGEVMSTESATANKSKEIHGNGLDKTILTGSLYPGPNNTLSVGNLTLQGCSGNGSIAFIDTVCVTNSYQNDGPTAVNDGVTLVVRCSSGSGLGGEGSITLGNHTTIDASQNESGGILFASPVYGGQVIVPSGHTVTFKGLNGYETTITGSKSGTYLLADGSITSSIYNVNVTSGTTGTASSGSLYYGLTNNVSQYITFDSNTEGTSIVFGSTSYVSPQNTRYIVGNGSDRTSISGLNIYHANPGQAVYTYQQNFIGVTLLGSTVGMMRANFYNCVVDGLSMGAPQDPSETTTNYSGIRFVDIKGCTFSNIIGDNAKTNYGVFSQYNYSSLCTIDSTIVTGYTTSNGAICFYASPAATASIVVSNSKFLHNYGNHGYNGVFVTLGNVTISNCYFEDNKPYAVCHLFGSTTTPTIITGSTFAKNTNSAANGIMCYNQASVVKFEGTNIINCRLYNSGSTLKGSGTFIFAPDSITVLSENENTKVTASVSGTLEVPSGSTAYVYPYGSTVGVDEPVAITGTGNTLLNNGKLGFLVSVASGTAANTLYDAIVGGGTVYSQIIFDPQLAGSTISCAPAVTIAKNTKMFGNGAASTLLKFDNFVNNNTTRIYDCTITGSTIGSANSKSFVPTNCVFTGCISQSQSMIGSYYSDFLIQNTTIDNCTSKSSWGLLLVGGSSGRIKSCTISNNTYSGSNRMVFAYTWSATSTSTIEDCIFTGNNSSSGNGIVQAYGPGKIYIKNCLFTAQVSSLALYSYAHQSEGFARTYISGSTFAVDGGTVAVGSLSGGNATLTFTDTNIFNTIVRGGGNTVLDTACILDLSGNTNSTVISGGTITVEGTATVIPYGGGTPVTISGSGTTLSNMGVLS